MGKASILEQEVDTLKINMKIMKGWIAETFLSMLPEDDIAPELIYEMIVSEDSPDSSSILEQMKHFVGEKEAKNFCIELWLLLISAQSDADGIPSLLVEKRKKDLEKQKEENLKAKLKLSRLQKGLNRSQHRPSKEFGTTRRFGHDQATGKSHNASKHDDIHGTRPFGERVAKKTNYNRVKVNSKERLELQRRIELNKTDKSGKDAARLQKSVQGL